MTIEHPTLGGIHHVTAITANAQKNLDFYCGVLGLRLVKLTVNFDDPRSYHLYYGDELGRPGSVITFFVWPDAPRGRVGPPQVSATAFAVPTGTLEYWSERLNLHGVAQETVYSRFGEEVLGFEDPDGLRLELVATREGTGHPWKQGPIPVKYAIRGFHSATVAEQGYEGTATLLTEVMGFHAMSVEGPRFRYRMQKGGFASTIDLLCVPDMRSGQLGAGVVHHIAYRTPDDEQQVGWWERIVGLGYDISPVMDRNYFHSIYYREPGGVLFEIATEGPGFTVDEPADRLGASLKLPPQFEPVRSRIERYLPTVHLPQAA